MEENRFGIRIKELRLKSGYSQRSLAEKVGINYTYLSKIENGVLPPPGEEVILRLAEVLNADKDELLTVAGRVPSDIVSQILKNPELLNSLRDKPVKAVDYSGNFGKRLRELREKAGLSQGELAEKAGINFTYLSKIENGVKPPPSRKVIYRLAEILRVDTDELFTIAGKVPADIVDILRNQETLQALRGNIQNKRKKVNRAGGIPMMRSIFNYKQLSRVALPVMLVIAVASSLWFAAPLPTRALELGITNPPTATTSQAYPFSVTINITDDELLPIDSINLSIYNTENASAIAHLNDLPVENGATKSYTDLETGGGAANVTVSLVNIVYGYGGGYVYFSGYGAFYYPVGYGYGGLEGTGSITYSVIWIPPADWPAGDYRIKLEVNADGDSFTKISSFTLSAANLVAETSLVEAEDTNGIAVVRVNIDRIKYSSNGTTATVPGGIDSFLASIVTTPGIQILAVNEVSPYTGVTYNATNGTFYVDTVGAPEQAANSTVAELVLRLTGNATTSCNLTVTFLSIGAAGDAGISIPGESPVVMTFQRGDTTGDGTFSVYDVLYFAQYQVFTKTINEIRLLNGASVNHGDDVEFLGDDPDVYDVLYDAQYQVGTKSAYFEVIP